MRWPLLVIAGLAAVGAAYLLSAGCAEDTTGVVVPNMAPTIRLTSGPIEDSLHIYRVTFHWTATDLDGELVGYEYAVSGDTTHADSLRTTTENWVSLSYTADDFYDSVIEPVQGLPQELFRFGRHHTFHVRAIDDSGARSAFASAAFFAVTVAPVTRIVNPNPRAVSTVGHSFQISWESEDLDGLAPPRLFSTRMVAVAPESLTSIGVERLDCTDCAPAWSEFGEDPSIRFDRLAEGGYIFGVRAMDEAGAVEPELVQGWNAMRLLVSAVPGMPVVTFSGPGLTVTLPEPDDSLKTFDISSGQVAAFAWEADASHYGATVVGYSYGVDLQTLDPNDPGWILTSRPAATITLHNPEGVRESEHIFYLQVRDSIDQVSVYSVPLRVGPPDFEFDILYVDDIGDQLYTGSPSNPSDAYRDSIIVQIMLAEAQRRGLVVDQYEVQDHHGIRVPGAPDLTLLRKYKLLIWSAGSSTCVFNDAMNPEGDFPINEYMELGGSLWLMGKRCLTRSIWGAVDEYFGFTELDFGYQYLHIETEWDGGNITGGEFLRPRGNATDQRIDGLDGAHPTPMAAAEGWPELLAVKPPYDGYLAGIPIVEGMTKGYVHGFRPGRFDTLYTFISNGSRWPGFPIPSRLDDAPCAFRFAGIEHGRTMVFTFPVFWWSAGALDSIGTRAMEFFFDETP